MWLRGTLPSRDGGPSHAYMTLTPYPVHPEPPPPLPQPCRALPCRVLPPVRHPTPCTIESPLSRATTLAASRSLSASRAGMTGARGRSASPTRRNKVAGSSQPSFPGSAPLHRSTTSVTRQLRRYFLLSASRSSAVVRGLGVSVSRCLGVADLRLPPAQQGPPSSSSSPPPL